MFGSVSTSVLPISEDQWRSAASHGATLQWALQTPGETIDDDATYMRPFLSGKAIRLAATVPIDVIDGLFADGWTLTELYDLKWKSGPELPDGFSETARRLRELYEAAPGAGGPDGALRWHALAAVMSADRTGLTDLQALRWLQVLPPDGRAKWASPVDLASLSLTDNSQRQRQKWVEAVGCDGWGWAAAGYTPDEARALRVLPAGHPDKPGPDQLAVMAALRET